MRQKIKSKKREQAPAVKWARPGQAQGEPDRQTRITRSNGKPTRYDVLADPIHGYTFSGKPVRPKLVPPQTTENAEAPPSTSSPAESAGS